MTSYQLDLLASKSKSKLRKGILIKIASVALFFSLSLFAWGITMMLPVLILTIAFILYISTIDARESILIGPNIVLGLFWGWGVFFRFIWVGFSKDDFLMVSYIKIENSVTHHINVSFVVLFSLLCVVVIRSIVDRKKQRSTMRQPVSNTVYTANSNVKLSKWIEVLYIFLIVFTFTYKFLNIRLATEQDYGTFDNAVNTMQLCVRFLAYLNLIAYFTSRKKKYLLAYEGCDKDCC